MTWFQQTLNKTQNLNLENQSKAAGSLILKVHPQYSGHRSRIWHSICVDNLTNLKLHGLDSIRNMLITTPQRTSVGFLPIIQAHAHDIDTLNTVVQRLLKITKTLKQNHIVLTVDEALFPGLMELKWSKYKDILIPRIGGLHTSMNFLRVIGQHMDSSGIVDVWLESEVLGPNVPDQIMSGKKYSQTYCTGSMANPTH